MGTAVVTGARGIGYEVGRGLARAGLRVIFGVRNLETRGAGCPRHPLGATEAPT